MVEPNGFPFITLSVEYMATAVGWYADGDPDDPPDQNDAFSMLILSLSLSLFPLNCESSE